MNFSLKCNQIVKLFATNTSACRHFRVCSSSSILRDKEVSDERKQKNKRVSSFLRYKSTDKNLIFKRFSTSPIVAGSRPSSQKESDDKLKDGTKENIPLPGDEFANLGLFAKFKKMYKEYWYVLVPVHLATSAVWFGTFYYASKSGMDIVAIMQHWNFNETLIKPFRDSSLGHVAVAYLLYKIATPARYTVTLGSTTVAIKHLVRLGYIKPVPSRAELMQIYQDKKETVQLKVADKKAEMYEKKEAMKEEFDSKKQQIMDDYIQFKEEFKDSMKTVGEISNPKPPNIEPDESEVKPEKQDAKIKDEKDSKDSFKKSTKISK
uniref:CSON014723 protein n=1 Tax=Culicoides sonorensis TaxID=179676 RepID=A0A336MH59_CULSO